MAAETEKWIKAETEKEMKAKRSVYECDPEKNTECKKTGCLYNPDSAYPVCHLTSKKEYAKDTQWFKCVKLYKKSGKQVWKIVGVSSNVRMAPGGHSEVYLRRPVELD